MSNWERPATHNEQAYTWSGETLKNRDNIDRVLCIVKILL